MREYLMSAPFMSSVHEGVSSRCSRRSRFFSAFICDTEPERLNAQMAHKGTFLSVLGRLSSLFLRSHELCCSLRLG